MEYRFNTFHRDPSLGQRLPNKDALGAGKQLQLEIAKFKISAPEPMYTGPMSALWSLLGIGGSAAAKQPGAEATDPAALQSVELACSKASTTTTAVPVPARTKQCRIHFSPDFPKHRVPSVGPTGSPDKGGEVAAALGANDSSRALGSSGPAPAYTVAQVLQRVLQLLKPTNPLEHQFYSDCYAACDAVREPTTSCADAGAIALSLSRCGWAMVVRRVVDTHAYWTRSMTNVFCYTILGPHTSAAGARPHTSLQSSREGLQHGTRAAAAARRQQQGQGDTDGGRGTTVQLPSSCYIVDANIKEHFRTVHMTERYRDIWECLPHIFIGRVSQLVPLLQLLCYEVTLSCEALNRQLPPWRSYTATLGRWTSDKCVDLAVPTVDAPAIHTTAFRAAYASLTAPGAAAALAGGSGDEAASSRRNSVTGAAVGASVRHVTQQAQAAAVAAVTGAAPAAAAVPERAAQQHHHTQAEDANTMNRHTSALVAPGPSRTTERHVTGSGCSTRSVVPVVRQLGFSAAPAPASSSAAVSQASSLPLAAAATGVMDTTQLSGAGRVFVAATAVIPRTCSRLAGSSRCGDTTSDPGRTGIVLPSCASLLSASLMHTSPAQQQQRQQQRWQVPPGQSRRTAGVP